jgi:hypothetical protein
MFGPDYELGACPGCSNLGDELDATRVHLSHRDVTLICFSRAPIDRLQKVTVAPAASAPGAQRSCFGGDGKSGLVHSQADGTAVGRPQ